MHVLVYKELNTDKSFGNFVLVVYVLCTCIINYIIIYIHLRTCLAFETCCWVFKNSVPLSGVVVKSRWFLSWVFMNTFNWWLSKPCKIIIYMCVCSKCSKHCAMLIVFLFHASSFHGFCNNCLTDSSRGNVLSPRRAIYRIRSNRGAAVNFH